MQMTKTLSFIAALFGSVLLGGFAGHSYFSHNTVEASRRIEQLEAEKLELAEQNQRLEFIQTMASEFSMDPRIVEMVDELSRRYVDPSQAEWKLIQTPEFLTHIMLSMIHAESRGKPDAVGDGGRARGLTQIWVSTANQYGEVEPEELLKPETNLKYSFQHFHYLLQRYKGNLALALYAWNRGASKIDRLIRYGESPSNGYGRKVYSASLGNAPRAVSVGD